MALIPSHFASTSSHNPSIPFSNYHVFLSFRGQDTRKTFTDHLYAALRRKGIVTFRDDEELERGEFISDKLIKAIDESMFAIVVLSQDYASSSWCLDELQKIIESRRDLRGTVFPVFYGVDPSDIRHQKGNIARAFEKHERRFAIDKVKRWRDALTAVSNISGWDTKDKHEAKIIEDIAEAVWTKLRDELPSNFDHLVGIQSKVDEMISLLKVGLSDVCFIGIWGMGGMGKTTLARVVYEANRSKFEACCFLANVREELEGKGLVYLQTKLLSCLQPRNIQINDSHDGVKTIRNFFCNKKVLIVLDDVSDISQLKNLAGNKDWFGTGSRIIVTTRDIHVLSEYDHFEMYEIEKLDRCNSLELLCQKAFKKDYPKEGFLELSYEVIEYAGGLPLALEVLGSLLCRRSESEWMDTLDKLKQNLSTDIFKTLRISYDELNDEEYKTIFLDIACFFCDRDEVEVIKLLENCGLHPTIGIKVLIERSLLSYKSSSIGGKLYLHMHDLLREMGRNIVLQECPNDAGKRSRLWSQDNIEQVLRGNKGTRKVQSIVLNLEKQYEAHWHPDCFSKMSNLRLLYFSNVHLSCSLDSLASTLKVLIWERYSLEVLPHIDQLYELVDLNLQYSKIRELWNGILFLDKLKFIDLSYSEDLIEMPEFSGIPNLESLFLKGCINLVKLHDSLGQLKKLVKLNLEGCKNLVTLPSTLEMNSLEELILFGCSRLKKLPKFGKNMKSLSICDVGGTNIKEVPPSIVHLKNLEKLSLRGCNNLVRNSSSSISKSRQIFSPIVDQKLFNSFSGLFRLKKLDLSFCNLCDGSIPDDLSGLSSLVKLDLSGNNFASLPVGCISNLLNLERFKISNCDKLQSIPKLPPNLVRVNASLCPSMESIKDEQHLFTSLISRDRSLLLHEVIFLHIQGDEIPTWFEERKYFLDHFEPSISIIVDMPLFVPYNNPWLRIAVCLLVKYDTCRSIIFEDKISWRFKALEDDNFSECEQKLYVGKAHYDPHLYIAFFSFNTQNRWRHFRGERRQLHFKVSVPCKLKDCGWRLISNW